MCKKIAGVVFVILILLSVIACGEKKEAEPIKAEPVKVASVKAVPLQVFEQEISSPAPPQTHNVNENITIPVTVKNVSNVPWPCKTASDEKSTNRVTLGYQWLDSTGKAIKDGRVMLSDDLFPGSSITLEAKVQAPSEPADYALRFSMVQENVAWFHNKGAVPLIINIKVQ